MPGLRVRGISIGRAVLGLCMIIWALTAAPLIAAAGLGGVAGVPVGPGGWAADGIQAAAAVENDGELGAPSDKLAPVEPAGSSPLWFQEESSDTGLDLEMLLVAAGFDDVMIFTESEMELLGDNFAAGWISPAGDLFGMLYVVPAEEPGQTMAAFLDELKQNCEGGFTGALGKLDALEGRTLGRAEATCGVTDPALRYDMVFYFTGEAALGITHVGFGPMEQKARDINSGLLELFRSW